MPTEHAARVARRIARMGTRADQMAQVIDEELALVDLVPAIKAALDMFDEPEFHKEDWWKDLLRCYEIITGLRPTGL